MIAKIRAGLALFVIAVTAIFMGFTQKLLLVTGIGDPRILPSAWHRIVLRMLDVRVKVVGKMAEGRPLLIVANHISWTDILVISGVAHVCFIAKSEMMTWPIFGSLARLQRTVFIERERKRKSGEQASELARRLVAGDAMVLFAEGSTSDGNQILPFKSTLFGAAEMAIKEGAADTVLVQPVAVTYTHLHGMPMGRRHRHLAAWIGDMDLVPHLSMLLKGGAMDVEVRFGEPAAFSASSDRKKVTRETEDAVRQLFAAALRDVRPLTRTR